VPVICLLLSYGSEAYFLAHCKEHKLPKLYELANRAMVIALDVVTSVTFAVYKYVAQSVRRRV